MCVCVCAGVLASKYLSQTFVEMSNDIRPYKPYKMTRRKA